jgi:hypothetical protein
VKIGVLYNCQNLGLAAALRALLPDAEVINYHSAPGLPDGEQRARAAVLGGCDHLVLTHLGAHHGRLSLRALRDTAKCLHVLPAFAFAGYHPDTCYVTVAGAPLDNCTGGYQSRIAVVAYLAGLSPHEAAGLYNKLVFSRLGYFGAFAAQSALLAELWARDGIAAGPLLAGWAARGCFAHSINHPKMPVLLDLARIACARMGVAARDGVAAEALPDDLARGPMHPVFPAIAEALGVAPEGAFCGGTDSRGRREVFTPADFAARCFEDFAGVAPEALLAAPGVQDAMTALGFSQRRHAVTRPAPGPGMVLMTHHGTLLRQAQDQVVHLPIAMPAALLRANGVAARQVGGALDGAELRRSARAGRVTLWRAGKYLCAERDSQAAGFSREAAGEWEHFVLLHGAAAALLARLMAQDWRLAATGDIVRRQLIRVEPGPVLRFGRWVVDLARDFPREEDGCVVLRLDGEPCLIQAVVPAPVVQRVDLPEPDKRLVLVGAPAWLPPPVTMCDADRDWVYRTAGAPGALNGRAQAADAVLRRALDQPVADGGPVPAGLSVRFWRGGSGALGWMDAAIQLQVLAAVAAEAAFLVPEGVVADALAAWRALGFQDLAFRRGAGGVAADLLWLDNADEASLPAEALAGLRARVGAKPVPGRKLFWRDGVAPGLEPVLAGQGFEVVDAAALPVVAQIALVSQASWVVGATGRVPLVFCPAGARVVELCGAAAFEGRDWVMAAKLGLMHGVLPGAPGLSPDGAKLQALLRMLEARTP